MISRDAKNLFIPDNKDCGLSFGLFQHERIPGINTLHSRGSGGCHSGLALEYNDTIGKVCRHDKVVFDHKRRLLSVQDKPTRNKYLSHSSTSPHSPWVPVPLDDLTSNDTLLGIQETERKPVR